MKLDFHAQFDSVADPADVGRAQRFVGALQQAVLGESRAPEQRQPPTQEPGPTSPPPAPFPAGEVTADISGGKKTRAPRKAATEPAPAAPTPAPAAPPPTVPAQPAAEAIGATPSGEELGIAIKRLGKVVGYAEARNVLTEFGVSRALEVPAEKRAAFLAAINAKLGAKANGQG